MKRNDIALYIFVGLVALGITSFFCEIKTSIIASVSIAALIFSIAQVIEAIINYEEEDTKSAFEVFNKVMKNRLTEGQLLFAKSYVKYFDTDKKRQRAKLSATILYCCAFVILFLGFVVPINIQESISAAITIFSAAVIFFSMWIAEKSMRRTEQWEEILKLALLQTQDCSENNMPMDATPITECDKSEV